MTVSDFKRVSITTDKKLLPPQDIVKALVADGATVIDKPEIFPSRYICVAVERHGERWVGETPVYIETKKEADMLCSLPLEFTWLTHPKIGRLVLEDEPKKSE